MQRKNTAKFGTMNTSHYQNNESFINRFKTDLTENMERSNLTGHPNDSHMNISQLELPKDDTIYINGTHKIYQNPNSNNQTSSLYKCPICERLRMICPYKNYKTYDFCQNCTRSEDAFKTNTDNFARKYQGIQQKRQNVQNPQKKILKRFFDQPLNTEYSHNSASKQLNSTLDQTHGAANRFKTSSNSHNLRHQINKSLQQVDKVRFMQSNAVYPLKISKQKPDINTNKYYNNYNSHSGLANKSSNQINVPYDTSFSNIRPRISSNTYQRDRKQYDSSHQSIQPPNYDHATITRVLAPPPPPQLTEQLIFYPVIHNQVVYRSAQRRQNRQDSQDQTFNRTHEVRKSRFMSQQETKNSRAQVGKIVSDFLNTTKPNEDDILTPNQFNKLAQSMYRENQHSGYHHQQEEEGVDVNQEYQEDQSSSQQQQYA